MRQRTLIYALAVIALAISAQAQPPVDSPVPTDSDIRAILVDRIDNRHQGVGIVVGVIEPSGRRFVAYGRMAKDDKRGVGANTVFEIGSATKVFTSLLLADMAQRGEVALADPAGRYLPAGVKLPERGGRQIALVDLATHTSGLPRLPENLKAKDPANPYADYSIDQLYQFLSTYQLKRDIGSKYEYSNLGTGLLGHVLARRMGMDYEMLLRSRVLEPLGMASTRITLSPEMKSRLAPGHNAALEPVANWDIPTLAGAGALRSTAEDMLTFLAANLGYEKSPLASAMATMLSVRRATGVPTLEIALGWHIFSRNGHEIVWHNGGTGGYRSFLGYDPVRHIGVVVLSNTETTLGVDDIGQHLLDTNIPLSRAPRVHKEVAVDPKLFDSYVGRYELAPNFVLTITRDGRRMFVQATSQPKVELFPESPRDFFLKAVDAQITFATDAQGRVTSLTLHQNGIDQQSKRIE